MNNKKVSVIIPVYNVEKFLDQCLSSVFEQDYPEFEVITINDASTDGSQKIIEKYKKIYGDKLIAINNECNGGLSNARNAGLKYLINRQETEYIIFIDSDDYIDNKYITTLVQAAEKSEAEIVICGQTQVDENNNFIREVDSTPDMVLNDKKYAMPGQAWSRLFCFSLIKKSNLLFSEGIIFEDVVYTLAINAISIKSMRIDYKGYFHRVNSKSIFGELRKNGLEDIKIPYNGLEESINYCLQKGKYESDIIEIFCLRILTTFIFDFARGSEKKVIKHLCNYTYDILSKYFPKYYKNQYVKLNKVKCFSLFQRMAVWIFVKSVRFKLLYPFARLMTSVKKKHK